MVKGIIFLILIFSTLNFFAQVGKKSMTAVRTSVSPKIDGSLDDECWKNALPASDFVQYEPLNGRTPTQKSEVKIVYDNTAIYVGAYLYDNNPDSILMELGERDNEDANTDWFNLDISAYQNGLNSFSFGVTAAGVQIDSKVGSEEQDHNWNAVFETDVQIVSDGWIVEMKIPYSALRFPGKEVQTWDINFWRHIRRYREWDTWTFVDKKQANVLVQAGELQGIKDIKPPLRLSLTPYISGYLEKDATREDWGYFFNGGMDLKLGLNESFTLDATLIPDFGQVQSDEEVLNLSPFETYYEEKRQFFTEGTELFDRCGIFYSRRIGQQPVLHDDAYSMNDSVQILTNPSESRLINASKVSGRTGSGLGIGVFNAMTSKTEATGIYLPDSSNVNITTQPFTNYNMVVLDQSFKQNSYFSLVNTNVNMSAFDYMANVSGGELFVMDNNNKYYTGGNYILSQKYLKDTSVYGHSFEFGFGKQKGNFHWAVGQEARNKSYDHNDMGYMPYNNYLSTAAEIAYNYHEPFGKFLSTRNDMSIKRNALFENNRYANIEIALVSMFQTKKHLSLGAHGYFYPGEHYDYYEARSDGRRFIKPGEFLMNFFYSPDYRKTFMADLGVGIGASGKYKNNDNSFYYGFNIGPRWRISNQAFLTYSFNYENQQNEYGFYDFGIDTIFFGKRQRNTITNSINASYIFTNKAGLTFKLRHYWSAADFKEVLVLNEEGNMDPYEANEIYDIDYSFFTIDLLFRWQFAPGSEMSVVWKNNIELFGMKLSNSYFDNLNSTFDSPQLNSFSIKVLYYLDYQYLRKKS